MLLGDKLRKLRTIKGLSEEALALELMISKTALRKWEANDTKPSIDNLMKICDYFETDIYQLLEEVSNVNLSHAKFEGSNYAGYAHNFTINNNISPEIITHLIGNQEKINQLFAQQAVLFEKLLKVN